MIINNLSDFVAFILLGVGAEIAFIYAFGSICDKIATIKLKRSNI